MNQYKSVLILVLVATIDFCHAFNNHYVFEFGQNYGDVVYEDNGNIPFLRPVTLKSIPVPPGYTITYVRVTVDAISPPKVDYSEAARQISIVFNWTQLSLSTYTITVKAVPFRRNLVSGKEVVVKPQSVG